MCDTAYMWHSRCRFVEGAIYYRMESRRAVTAANAEFVRMLEPWQFIGVNETQCGSLCFRQCLPKRIEQEVRLNFSKNDALSQFFSWREVQLAMPYLDETWSVAVPKSPWEADSLHWLDISANTPLMIREAEAGVQVRAELSESVVESIVNSNAEAIDLSYCRISRAVAERLVRELPRVRILIAHHAHLGESTAEVFREWEGLTELDLNSCRLGMVRLEWLSEMGGMRCLDLGWSNADGNAVLRLLERAPMVSFRLDGVFGGEVDRVTEMPMLEDFRLFGADIGDECAGSIVPLARLAHLSIGGTRITDKGVQRLSDMRGLRELGLAFTSVSDRGVREIARKSQLQRLALRGSQVSRSGLEYFANRQPRCRIEMDSIW